ncbi:DUF3137 domain-containing protein [uncultured Maricaulis sp.]|uniref:DUF3137 domain-containing protein n=1 Tax=uncultured Maricaulis sp. TaxID=174710 RepID=UPI0030DA9944
MDARFQTVWDERLAPWLAELEEERKRVVRLRWIWLGVGAAVGLIGAAAFFGVIEDPGPLMFLIILGPFLGFIIGNSGVASLAKRIKLELNMTIAETLGLTYQLKPYAPARFDRLRTFGLLPSSDRQTFEDHFTGERDGCDFELYEADLKQRRKTGKSTSYVTVFRGVIIRITFPRKVEGITVISRDQGVFNGLNALGRSFGGVKLERIGLVDPVFEKAFEVYGNDQVLARYMLTPSFMERLLALETTLKGKNVRALFDQDSGQGELIIAAETGNLFEAGSMLKPLTEEGRFSKIIDDLNHITALIDLLIAPSALNEHEARQGV